MENEFHRHYKERVMPALQKLHGYKNVHQVPRVEKVVINTSVGSQSDVKQALEEAKAELALITGQRPVETLAKKSISNFKLRKDQAIGAKVTLRGERMYEFLERFIKAALPRIRDFRGVSPRCFDKHGNYTIGISDQSIFPEIELDKIKRNIGFDVTIVTTARSHDCDGSAGPVCAVTLVRMKSRGFLVEWVWRSFPLREVFCQAAKRESKRSAANCWRMFGDGFDVVTV